MISSPFSKRIWENHQKQEYRQCKFMFVIHKIIFIKRCHLILHNGYLFYTKFILSLLTKLLLFNSPSTCCRLGYHGVWIRAHTFLQWSKEPLLLYWVKKPKKILSTPQIIVPHPDPIISSSVSALSSALPWYRSHRWGGHATCTAMFTWHLQLYSYMGYKVFASSAATTRVYSHVPSATSFAVIPTICLAAWWWKTSRIFNIAFFTTQQLRR